MLIFLSPFAVLAESSAPDLQRALFIHYRVSPARSPPSAARAADVGYYKLLGVKWHAFPVSLKVNPSGYDQGFVLAAVGFAAEEWDSGAYSQSIGVAWYGVAPDLFAPIGITDKGYDDLAWTSAKLDKENSLVWGDYPTAGVIAVTIVWYNVRTKAIVEVDIVFDTDYAWGNASANPSVIDLQNIATHEIGHCAGMGDVYLSAAYRETMYGYSTYGEVIKRDLYIGDKKGITKLYGTA